MDAEQGRLHTAGRDLERLDVECANASGNGAGDDQHIQKAPHGVGEPVSRQNAFQAPVEPFQSFRVRFRQSDGIQLRFQLVEFRFGLFRQDIVICREGMADRRPEFFEQFPALPVFEK